MHVAASETRTGSKRGKLHSETLFRHSTVLRLERLRIIANRLGAAVGSLRASSSGFPPSNQERKKTRAHPIVGTEGFGETSDPRRLAIKRHHEAQHFARGVQGVTFSAAAVIRNLVRIIFLVPRASLPNAAGRSHSSDRLKPSPAGSAKFSFVSQPQGGTAPLSRPRTHPPSIRSSLRVPSSILESCLHQGTDQVGHLREPSSGQLAEDGDPAVHDDLEGARD